jgi:hypothetical protein
VQENPANRDAVISRAENWPDFYFPDWKLNLIVGSPLRQLDPGT